MLDRLLDRLRSIHSLQLNLFYSLSPQVLESVGRFKIPGVGDIERESEAEALFTTLNKSGLGRCGGGLQVGLFWPQKFIEAILECLARSQIGVGPPRGIRVISLSAGREGEGGLRMRGGPLSHILEQKLSLLLLCLSLSPHLP